MPTCTLRLAEALCQSPFERDIENRVVSATVADAVVDTVVLLPYGAVERRRTRRLRDATPRDGCTGPGNIVLPEKLPRRRPAEFRGDESAAVLRSAATPVISAVEMMTKSADFTIVSSCLLRPPAPANAPAGCQPRDARRASPVMQIDG